MIPALLRRHLPAERRQVAEDFLGTDHGCGCLRELIRGDDGPA
jgi:hypothetical protein